MLIIKNNLILSLFLIIYRRLANMSVGYSEKLYRRILYEYHFTMIDRNPYGPILS